MRRLLWALLLSLAGLSSAFADSAEPYLQVIGRPILGIEIKAPPDEDPDQLLRLTGLNVGEPYRVAQVRRAIKLLFSLGRFDTVRVLADLEPDGVRLTIELPPEPRLVELRLLRSEVLSEDEVQEALQIVLGAPIGPRDLPGLSKAIKGLLVSRGYRDPAVGLGLEDTDAAGGRALLVRIDEGPRTRLRRVVVGGQPRLPLWQIGRSVGLRGGEVLDLTDVQPALDDLVARYRSLGYLDAEIGPPVVRDVPGEGLADLVLDVRAGPQVRLRFKGNEAVPSRDLRVDAAPLRELGTGSSVLAEVKERILSRYSKHGFWRVQVEVAARVTPDRSKKELLFSIREGTPARVQSIRFPGNHHFDPDVLSDRIFETVARALSSDLGRPGADPEVVGQALGDHSLATPRDSPQPDTTAPDPKKVYLPRAYRAAAEAIEDLYRSEGFQNVEVLEPQVRELDRPGQLVVEITVKEGVRWRVGALSFSGNDAVDSAQLFALSGLEPVAGEPAPLAFAKVEEARRSLLAHYRNLGYLFVRVYEELRQVPPRGSLGWDYVRTSTQAPFDVQAVCARAAAAGQAFCDVELKLRIDERVKVTAGDIIVRGVQKTRRGVIEDEVQVATGTVLTESDLVETRDNLLRVGVFERVNVRPIDEDRVEATKDVLVEVKERKSYSLDLGGGFSTAEGLRGVVSFGDRNLFGTALKLQLQAKLNLFLQPLLVLYDESVRDAVGASYTCQRIDTAALAESPPRIVCIEDYSVLERLEYEMALGLSYPRIFGLPPGFSAGMDLTVLRDYDAAYAEQAQRLTLVANYKGFRPVVLGKPRPVTIQVRSAFERSALGCNPALTDRYALCSTTPGEAFVTGRLQGTNFYLGAGPRISWDLRDDSLDPRAGVYMELTADAALGLDQGSPNLASLQGRVNAYIPLASRLTVALAAVFGRIFPLEAIVEGQTDIPINRRFFAGGRSTVRGYAERTLIPQDAEVGPGGVAKSSISTGGQSMLALKSELRVALYGPVSLAIFYDIGDLWEGGQFSLKTESQVAGVTVTRTLAHGGGVGLRVATPIGPLSLDFAVPFNKRDPIVNDTQLHFSVGAF